jgi:hypothetical protein
VPIELWLILSIYMVLVIAIVGGTVLYFNRAAGGEPPLDIKGEHDARP